MIIVAWSTVFLLQYLIFIIISLHFNLFQRQIEKYNDLVEECKNIKEPKGQNLKEFIDTIQVQVKSFREKLEETRERLEDSARCFSLLDAYQDIYDSKEHEEFVRLAKKSGNEKLEQILKVKTI